MKNPRRDIRKAGCKIAADGNGKKKKIKRKERLEKKKKKYYSQLRTVTPAKYGFAPDLNLNKGLAKRCRSTNVSCGAWLAPERFGRSG